MLFSSHYHPLLFHEWFIVSHSAVSHKWAQIKRKNFQKGRFFSQNPRQTNGLQRATRVSEGLRGTPRDWGTWFSLFKSLFLWIRQHSDVKLRWRSILIRWVASVHPQRQVLLEKKLVFAGDKILNTKLFCMLWMPHRRYIGITWLLHPRQMLPWHLLSWYWGEEEADGEGKGNVR